MAGPACRRSAPGRKLAGITEKKTNGSKQSGKESEAEAHGRGRKASARKHPERRRASQGARRSSQSNPAGPWAWPECRPPSAKVQGRCSRVPPEQSVQPGRRDGSVSPNPSWTRPSTQSFRADVCAPAARPAARVRRTCGGTGRSGHTPRPTGLATGQSSRHRLLPRCPGHLVAMKTLEYEHPRKEVRAPGRRGGNTKELGVSSDAVTSRAPTHVCVVN